MGLLRKIGRNQKRGLLAVGTNSRWKEDLISLQHLIRCLGFTEAETRSEVWADKKPGHFIPGVRVMAQGKTHAFALEPVPGTLDAAARSWRAFLDVTPFSAEMFNASNVATPEYAEELVAALEREGFRVPAKERAEGNHLTPVAG